MFLGGLHTHCSCELPVSMSRICEWIQSSEGQLSMDPCALAVRAAIAKPAFTQTAQYIAFLFLKYPPGFRNMFNSFKMKC